MIRITRFHVSSSPGALQQHDSNYTFSRVQQPWGITGTHIVQRQTGILNNFKGFFSHARAWVTGTNLYAFPDNYSGSFSSLNFEQQAVIVENAGRIGLGQNPRFFPFGRNVSVPRTLGLYLEYRGVIAP